VAVGSRKGHLVRSFLVTAKGVINVENAVRDDENVFFFDDAVEMRTRRAVRPTELRKTSSGRRGSTTADHSPRLSPQKMVAASAAVSAAAVCGEISADLSSRRRRSEQLESTEYKVLVVGDHGVGKTELICQFTTSYAAVSTPAGCRHHSHHHRRRRRRHRRHQTRQQHYLLLAYHHNHHRHHNAFIARLLQHKHRHMRYVSRTIDLTVKFFNKQIMLS